MQRIKWVVDRDRRPGQFLLTGSVNLLLMRRVSETLAGRAIYMNLRTLTESEKSGSASPGPWEKLLHARDAAAERLGIHCAEGRLSSGCTGIRYGGESTVV